jgi:hypothetical protein
MTKTLTFPDFKDSKYKDSLIQQGTYKIEGSKYMLQTTLVKMTSENPAQKKAVDAQNDAYEVQSRGLFPETGTLKWKGKDEVVLTIGDGKAAQVSDLKRSAK